MSTTTAGEKARIDAAYAAHRSEQIRRWAQIPFAQKLQWLEDAHKMALALQKSCAQQQGGQGTPQVLEDAAASTGAST